MRGKNAFRLYIVTSIILTSSSLTFPQKFNSDSIIRVYNTLPDNDRKLELAYKISIDNLNSDSTKFLKYAFETLRLCDKCKNSYTKSLINFKIGLFYSQKNILKSFEYTCKSLEIATSLDSLNMCSSAYSLLGTLYYYTGDHSKSFENYFESLKINERINNTTKLGADYNNLAIIHCVQKNYKKGLEYYFKSLHLYNKNGKVDASVNTLSNISLLYGKIDSIDQQFKYAKLALETSRKTNGDIAPILFNISDLYIYRKEYKKAEESLQEAEAILKKQGRSYYLNHIYHTYGYLYESRKDLSKAIEYYLKSLKNAQKEGLNFLIRENYLSLSSVYKTQKNFEKSLYYHELYHNISDSLSNIEKEKKFTELELRHEYETELKAKEKEERFNKQQLSLQRRIIFSILVALLLAISLIVLIIRSFRSQRKINSILSEQNRQIQEQSNELKTQRDQLKHLNATRDKLYSIIAHDLINPFNAIVGFSSLIIENGRNINSKKKLEYVEIIYQTASNTFSLLKNLLDWARSQTGNLTIDNKCIEIKACIDDVLMLLNNVAEFKKISILNHVEPSLFIVADANMMDTVFRNLLSNALKFTGKNGTILIKNSQPSKGEISITVEDNGVGISEDVIAKLFIIESHTTSQGTNSEKGTGLGLLLCKEFVEKNNGRISVESQVGVGSKFTVTLPYG